MKNIYKYFADLSIISTIENPYRVVVYDYDKKNMYTMNSDSLKWFISDSLYVDYLFGKDDLKEITEEKAKEIVKRWGGEWLIT